MNNTWVQECGWNTTSQTGEDGMLAAIFDRIGQDNSWAIECGAYDGKKYSNTWRLINECDWNAILIEKQRPYYRLLRKRYTDNDKVHYIHAAAGITETDGMDAILSETPCPLGPDLCVLDIDGFDYQLWECMVKYRPRVLMIEFNPTIPFWVHKIQDINLTAITGSSLGALVELGKNKGYELIAVTRYNAIFIVNTLFPSMGIEDNSLWALARHTINTVTYVYQSFDNKIGFGGCDSRRWGGRHRLIRDLSVKGGRI
jgi:hypothetical protein